MDVAKEAEDGNPSFDARLGNISIPTAKKNKRKDYPKLKDSVFYQIYAG